MTHIERLTRLHIEGDLAIWPLLTREWDRRGERWCVADNPPPIRTLEALREWAEVEFPLLRVFNSSTRSLGGVELWDDSSWVASVRIGDDLRPSLVWWGGHNARGIPTYIRTHCILYDQQLQLECRGGRPCRYNQRGITWDDNALICAGVNPASSSSPPPPSTPSAPP